MIEREPFLWGENPFYHDESTYERLCDRRVVESD